MDADDHGMTTMRCPAADDLRLAPADQRRGPPTDGRQAARKAAEMAGEWACERALVQKASGCRAADDGGFHCPGRWYADCDCSSEALGCANVNSPALRSIRVRRQLMWRLDTGDADGPEWLCLREGPRAAIIDGSIRRDRDTGSYRSRDCPATGGGVQSHARVGGMVEWARETDGQPLWRGRMDGGLSGRAGPLGGWMDDWVSADGREG